MEDLAGVVRREGIGSEEDVAWSDLTWLPGSLHWHLVAELRNLLLIERCRNQWGPYWSRSYTVDSNASVYQLQCQSSYECHNGPLGGSIIKQLGVSLICID